MIWILLGYLLFGGSSLGPLQTLLEDRRERIENTVTDDSRRERATTAVDDMLKRVTDVRESFETMDDDFIELLRNRGSRREQFDAHFQSADAMRFGLQKALLDMRDEMRESLQPAEWTKVFPGPD